MDTFLAVLFYIFVVSAISFASYPHVRGFLRERRNRKYWEELKRKKELRYESK